MPVHYRLPQFHRLNGGMPVVEKNEAHPWENKVTFNPACVLVDDRDELAAIISRLPFAESLKRTLGQHPALCFLMYRAQGMKTSGYDHTRSSIGLAVLTPDLRLIARHTAPVISPEADYEILGVEDGRVTRVGDRYVMVYCAYSAGQPHNRIRIATASTQDFVHWEKHGLLKADFNDFDNKNGMLFQGQIDGKYLMLHRPMSGPDAMAIHWAEADDVFGTWKSRGTLMKPASNPAFVDTWIGGGAPPLRMQDGRYLIIYHIGNRKADASREYDLGIAIADMNSTGKIVRRDELLLRPGTPAETTGDADLGVNNVVFVCGAFFHGGDLYVPYAGADSVVLAGRISGEDLKEYVQCDFLPDGT